LFLVFRRGLLGVWLVGWVVVVSGSQSGGIEVSVLHKQAQERVAGAQMVMAGVGM
jgi:hypothetical protein